jgi:hypothetical protein
MCEPDIADDCQRNKHVEDVDESDKLQSPVPNNRLVWGRPQGQSRDGESNLLASIPAPFDTLSILRRRASTAGISEISERSLTLNEDQVSVRISTPKAPHNHVHVV